VFRFQLQYALQECLSLSPISYQPGKPQPGLGTARIVLDSGTQQSPCLFQVSLTGRNLACFQPDPGLFNRISFVSKPLQVEPVV
jgi:hypothetical protein